MNFAFFFFFYQENNCEQRFNSIMSYSYSNFHLFSPQTSWLNFSGARCIFLTGKFGNATGNGQQRRAWHLSKTWLGSNPRSRLSTQQIHRGNTVYHLPLFFHFSTSDGDKQIPKLNLKFISLVNANPLLYTADLKPNMISSWRRWASSSIDRMASVSTASQGRKRLFRLFFSVRTTCRHRFMLCMFVPTYKNVHWLFLGPLGGNRNITILA